RKRRLLIIDEAHNLESQLVSVFTVAFPPEQAKAWFGGPLPRLDSAEDYRSLMREHLERMEGQLETVTRVLESMRPADIPPEAVLRMPPSRAERELMGERESLETALTRVRFFVDAEDREWIVRYPPEPAATLELVPLTVASLASELLSEAAELVVLS